MAPERESFQREKEYQETLVGGLGPPLRPLYRAILMLRLVFPFQGYATPKFYPQPHRGLRGT